MGLLEFEYEMAYGGVVVGGWQGGVEIGQVVLLLAADVGFTAYERDRRTGVVLRRG